MATITAPLNSAPIAVQPGQALRLTADASVAWSYRVNEGSWTAITTAASIVFTTPTAVTHRWTFDRLELAIGDTAAPDDTRDFNLCEGPPAVQWATPALPDPTGDPAADPNAGEGDDPPHALAWRLPGAQRDGFSTESAERAHVPGGPVTLVESFRGGIFVDSAGKVGARTTLLGRVAGLGPFPESASYHHGGTYFEHDFGKGRTIGLTRVLLEDGAGNVAVVRGDGRRNTYRALGTSDGVTSYEAAAGLRSTLQKLAGWGNQPFGISPYGGGTCFVEEAPTGRRFGYAEDGKLTHVLDRAGNLVVYSYGTDGRLQKIQSDPTGGSGLVPYFSYDGDGRLARLVFEDPLDPANDRTAYFSYDGAGNLQRLQGPEGCETYFVYGGTGSGFLTRAEDAEGFAWEVAYQSDVVSTVVDARGNAAYFAFDTGAARATKVDRTGTVTYMDFDAFGAPTALSNPGTEEDLFTYDGEGGLVSTTNRLGNAWSFERDGRGNRIAVTDPLGARTYLAFDAEDSVRTAVDPLGRVAYFAYDAERNRTVAVDALGQATYYAWSAAGLLETRQDRRGAVTTLVHDEHANLTRVVDPLGNATYFAFNSAGETVAMTDPLGRTTTIERDLKGRVEKQTDPIGAATYLAYDARCNLVAQKDALLRETSHEYDGNSNRTLTLQPTLDGERFATYFAWDEEDRPQSMTDALFRATSWAYDALGRRQSQTDALAGVRDFAYDAAHELTMQRDERQSPSYLRYDEAGRMSHRKDALFHETYMGYDLKGNHVMSLAPGLTIPASGIFWTDSALDTIKRVNPDGGNVTTVVSSGLSVPRGIVVHAGLGVMIWIDSGDDTIKRAKLDGTGEVTLVSSGLSTPRDLAVDFGAGKLYWIDSGNDTIKRAELDGSGVATILSTGLATPEGLAIDPEGGKLYWTDSGNQTIKRCDLDGGSVETLVDSTHVSAPSGVTLDLEAGHVIWTDPGNATIKRADLDGSDVATLVSTGLQTPRGVALDPIGEQLYWVDAGTDKLQRANLDGSGVTDLVTSGLSVPEGIALELPARVTTIELDALDRPLAVTDALRGVRRSVFDAEGNRTRAIDPLGKATYFAFDLAGRQTHVEDQLGNVTYLGYDRASQQVLRVDPLGAPTYLRYDAAGRQEWVTNALEESTRTKYDLVGNVLRTVPPSEAVRMFWTDSGSDVIGRADVDGSGATSIVTSGLSVPRGLGVDAEAGHVYWIDSGNDTIKRADLDGGNVSPLVSTGLSTPRGLALDLGAGHMYWTDSGNDTIKRADLTGANVVTLISSGLATPEGIALDLVERKMYWTDSGDATIKRAALDGSGVGTIVSTGLQSPAELAVDPIGGKVYWVDSGTDKVQRANLDGSDVEDLLTTGLVTPRGIALDLAARKLYVIDSGNDTIQRANLDGSEVETLVSSGLSTPEAIALEVPVRGSVHAFDALNRRTSSTDPYGSVSLTEYDPVGNVLTSVDPRGGAQYFSYDALNRRTHAQDNVHFAPTYMGYDPVGNVVLDVDALGFAAYHTYDVLSRRSFSLDRAGALTYHHFDEVGNQVRRHVLLGAGGEERVTYMRFDPLDRQTHVVDALGGVAYMGYDASSNQVLRLDQVGRPTYLTYDELDRASARSNAFGETSTTVYDARSSVVKQIDGEGRTQYFAYDLLGRREVTSNALGDANRVVFDARGNQVRLVNPRGHATYLTYDLRERRTHRKDALGGVSYHGFDAVGNQVLQLDELGNPSYFQYDLARRLTEAKDAALAVTAMEYDPRGAAVKRISPVGGETTYMGYDAAGRLERQWFASPGTADMPTYFVYDQVGNLLEVDDSLAGLGVSANQFDKLNRLLQKNTLAGAVYYAYDLSGRKVQMKDRDLEQSDYVFDAAGRMTAVQLAAGRTAYLSYDQAGLLSRKVLPNHEVVSYHRYDVAARLEQLEHWRDNSGLELVTYFHYERNPNGAITRIRHEAGENSYFSYDALERLTAERRVATSFDRMNLAYDYDAASNRTLKIERIQNVNAYFTYDGRNLLTREWSTSPFFNSTVYFAHDGAQRMTSARSAELQSNYFTFDQRDRVTRVEFADAFAPDEAREFGHTGVGERVRLAIGGEETYLTYDGSKLLTERDSSGLLRRYRHNQSGADARGSLIEVSDVVDSVERTMYPAFDQRGSLVRLEEAGSADASAYAYSSFGEAVPIEPSQIESEQRLGFVSPVLLRLETANEETMLTSGDVYLPRPGSATSNVSVYGPNVSGGVLRQQGPSGPDFDPCGPRPLTPPVGLDPAGQWVRVDYPDCWKWLPADTSRSWGCPPPPAPPAGKTWILLSPWPSCAWSLVDDNPRGEKCPCYVDLHFVEVTQPTLRALSGLFIDAPNDAILVHSQLEVQRSERHTAGTTVCPRYVLELTDFIPEPDTPDHPDLQKRHGQIKSGYAGAPDSPIAHLSRRAVGKTYGIFRWRGGHVRGPRLYRDRIAEDNCGLVDCLLEAIEDVPTLNYGQIVDYGRVPDRWTSNSIPAFLLARCGVDVYTVLEEFQRAHYRAFPIGWIAGATLGSERG